MGWINDLIFCGCCILFMVYGTKCVNGYYNYSHIFNHLSFDEKQSYFRNTWLVKYLCLGTECVPYFKIIALNLIVKINNILFVLNQVLIHITNILSTECYIEIKNRYCQELELLSANGSGVVNNYNGVLEQIPLIDQENDKDEKSENMTQNLVLDQYTVCLEDIDLSMSTSIGKNTVLETEQVTDLNVLPTSNELSETIETFPMAIMENIHGEITNDQIDTNTQINFCTLVPVQTQDVYENLADYLNSYNISESNNLDKTYDLDDPNDLIEIEDIDFSKTLEEQPFVKNNVVVQNYNLDVKQNEFGLKSGTPSITQTIKIGKKKRVVN